MVLGCGHRARPRSVWSSDSSSPAAIRASTSAELIASTVAASKRDCRGTSTPKDSSRRVPSSARSSEWPPRVKKSSWTPIRSTASRSVHSPTSCSSRSVRRGHEVGARQLSGHRQTTHVDLGRHEVGRQTVATNVRTVSPRTGRAGGGTTFPTRRGSWGGTPRTSTTASATSGCLRRAARTLPGSIRNPRSLAWSSTRPRNSSVPVSSYRPLSPVR